MKNRGKILMLVLLLTDLRILDIKDRVSLVLDSWWERGNMHEQSIV